METHKQTLKDSYLLPHRIAVVQSSNSNKFKAEAEFTCKASCFDTHVETSVHGGPPVQRHIHATVSDAEPVDPRVPSARCTCRLYRLELN